MALNIKDPQTDALVRRLAAMTGESITDATRTAVEERLARLERRRPATTARDAVLSIMDRGRARAALRGPGGPSEDEILGYGPDGLPG